MHAKSQLSNKVFRDNIRGNRLIPVSEKIVGIIDTPAFQRLRWIKQMGLSSYVFPTAEHSRFAHSIGVYSTAYETFQTLRRKAEPLAIPFPAMRFDEDAEAAFCVAAMCHDLGHTAFSHALEDVLLPHGMKRHEACTLAYVATDTALISAIKAIADIDAVILLIEKEHPNRALSQLISGPFDVDRCDYLLRDSQNAGVYYGQFDFTWLLHSLSVAENSLGQPILLLDGPRGLDALRQFMSARRYMHRQVYYHPTIRAAQILLRAIFDRISQIDIRQEVIDRAPSSMANLLRHEGVTFDDLSRTTDVQIFSLIHLLQESETDITLQTLAKNFLNRHFPKCVLDSARTHKSLRGIHWPDDEDGPDIDQPFLWHDEDPVRAATLIEECRDIVGKRLAADGKPADLARYLVASERIQFRSDPPTDFVFSYGNAHVSLDEIDHLSAGYNVPKLMDTFVLYRMFAPNEYKEIVSDHISTYNFGEGTIRGNRSL